MHEDTDAASRMILSGRPRDAFAIVAGQLAGSPAAARPASIAALAVFASGSAADRARLVELTAPMPPEAARWALLVVGAGPPGPAGERAPRSHLALDDAGIAAWLRDDTRTAVRRLHDPLGLRSPAGGDLIAAAHALPLLLALADAGHWREADRLADRVADDAARGGAGALGAGAIIVRATLAAMRGDATTASRLLAAADRTLDLAGNGLLDVLATRARALAAVAVGRYETACAEYASLFDRTGKPRVHWAADRFVGEYATIAVRTGATDRVGRVVERIGRRRWRSPRVRLALTLARGLLAGPAEAEAFLRTAATDPAGDAWPADRAVARLHYADHLRRQRRFTEADPLLREALEDARRFGAVAFEGIVQEGLRANGSAVERVSSSSFTTLTAQQQHIVRLAAGGLRNREIAARLSMSERTVGSHLYHVYPKLGVTGRHQLHKVLDEAG